MTEEERARDAVEHLQAAAVELIAAARIVLDGIEDLVRDPSPLLAAAATMAAKGRAAAGAPRASSAAEGDTPSAPRVQRIRVS